MLKEYESGVEVEFPDWRLFRLFSCAAVVTTCEAKAGSSSCTASTAGRSPSKIPSLNAGTSCSASCKSFSGTWSRSCVEVRSAGHVFKGSTYLLEFLFVRSVCGVVASYSLLGAQGCWRE